MNNVIKFKISGATMFHLPGDHPLIMPKLSVKHIDLWESHGIATPAPTLQLEHEVHSITLPDTEPKLPRRRESYDDALWSAITAEAFRQTVEKRREAQALRERIRHLLGNGSITEIVEDESGFMSEDDEPLSEAELAAAAKLPTGKASK